MKHVSEFVSFDFVKWSYGKVFEVKAIYNNVDKNTGADLGGKNVQLIIAEDKCPNYVINEKYETGFTMKSETFYIHAGKVTANIGDRVSIEKPICKVAARSINGKTQGYLTVYFDCAEIKKI